MRTFLNSYKPVCAFDVHSTLSGFSNGSFGCQYSIIPPTSTEMTVSWRELYCRFPVSTRASPKVTKERTAIRCTLCRCIDESVCRGLPSPRPS